MKNKNVIMSVVIGVLIFAVSAVCYFRYAENANYEKTGAELIDKIEEYRKQNDKLPNTIEDLDIKEPMNEGAYYEKKDSTDYIVFFNIGFDNTKTYYSKTKQWKNEH